MEGISKEPPPMVAALSAQSHPWHRGRSVWVIALIAAALVAAVGTAIDFSRRIVRPGPPVLLVAPVTRGLVTGSVRASGMLEPVQTTVVAQPVAARLVQVGARPGERVLRGQVLARFDPLSLQAEFVRAEARVVAAEVASFEAKIKLARLARQLPRDGMETPEEVEDWDDAGQIMLARVASAAAELAAREAAYRLARQRLAARVVRAPSDGVVLSRHVDEGQMVAEGSTLFRLAADPSSLQVTASVREADMAAVKPGQEVRFSVPALPGRWFGGKVALLQPLTGPEIDRRLPVIVRIDPGGEDLRAGMTAKLTIDTSRDRSVVRIPSAALLFAPRGMSTTLEEPAVWLTTTGSPRLERVGVILGVRDGTFIEVRGDGLREGAAVAVGYALTR